MTARLITLLLLGMLALLAVGIFCVQKNAPLIEADLTTRSSQVLASAGIPVGTITADGQQVTLQGVVADETIRQQAGDLVAGLKGVTAVDNQLMVDPLAPLAIAPAAVEPPYPFNLEYNGSDVILSGFVPNSEARQKIFTTAEATFGAGQVSDRLKIADGAPDQFVDIVTSRMIPHVKSFENGAANLQDTALTFNGQVSSANVKQQLQQQIGDGLPQPYNVVYSLTTPGTSCQQRFAELLSQEQIHFRTNQAIIQSSSFPLLRHLIVIAGECPDSQFEIAGHTDSSGSAEHNQTLSQRRAVAVVTYLTENNIEASRLRANGYGETSPIAGNESTEGRAKNRRIEFTLLPQ